MRIGPSLIPQRPEPPRAWRGRAGGGQGRHVDDMGGGCWECAGISFTEMLNEISMANLATPILYAKGC
jgi:hypothetical protein